MCNYYPSYLLHILAVLYYYLLLDNIPSTISNSSTVFLNWSACLFKVMELVGISTI